MIDEKLKRAIFTSIPLGFNFWDYRQLTINVRQQSDHEFSNILNRIRVGAPTNEDMEILEKQIIPNSNEINWVQNAVNFYLQKMETFPNILALFPITKTVDEFNSLITNQLKMKVITVNAIDTFRNRQPATQNYKSNKKRKIAETAGLESQLVIGIGSRIILKRNIDVVKGLVNGALGIIQDFKYNKVGEVNAIFIKFDNCEDIYELEKHSADYELNRNIYVTRTQFPISLAWALTIHKSQGLSLDCLLVDLGPDIFEGG